MLPGMPNTDQALSLLAIRGRVTPSGRLWNPAADVYEGGEGWMVKVDLAGISSDELEILAHESLLIIRGCRRDTFYREGFTYQRMEITYSQFEKSIDFPCPIEEGSLSHDYHDGFLIIRLRCK